MKNNWQQIKFKDFITLQRGYDLFKTEYKEGLYPVIGATEIAGYHNKYKVEGPGITVGRTGTIGHVQLIKENFWPHQDCLFVKDYKGNDLLFVYYTLKALPLSHLDAGGAVPALNRNHLDNIKISRPDIPIQQHVASILSAYDDLIEVNNQRIKILEETASQLYKEWFVRMRFPGYKHTKFDKGIPHGWEVKKVKDAFDILGGGTPSTENDEYWNGDINWFTPTDITGSHGIFLSAAEHKITEGGLNKSSAKMFPPYSIMMTSRATIGAVGINTTAACTNQGFITCLPNERLPFTYLYYWILSNKEMFENLASGSTFLEITKGTFKKIDILIPARTVIDKYHETIEPILKQTEVLQQQNTQLQQIRDRLLPRLISGKLQIKTQTKTQQASLLQT